MCIQRTVGVANARQLWVIMHWLRLDGHPYKLPIAIRDWSEFQSCKNKVPRWRRNYLRFAFLGFGRDVLPTPITFVDPGVKSFRISRDSPSFRLLAFRVTFRRSAVPPFHCSSFQGRLWFLAIESHQSYQNCLNYTNFEAHALLSSFLDNGTNNISRHRHCKFKFAFRIFVRTTYSPRLLYCGYFFVGVWWRGDFAWCDNRGQR